MRYILIFLLFPFCLFSQESDYQDSLSGTYLNLGLNTITNTSFIFTGPSIEVLYNKNGFYTGISAEYLMLLTTINDNPNFSNNTNKIYGQAPKILFSDIYGVSVLLDDKIGVGVLIKNVIINTRTFSLNPNIFITPLKIKNRLNIESGLILNPYYLDNYFYVRIKYNFLSRL